MRHFHRLYAAALTFAALLTITGFPAQCEAQQGFPLAYDMSKGGGAFGPSVAVDANFAFYQNQPWSKTFSDIKRAGFTAVHIIDTGTAVSKGTSGKNIVAACKAAGLVPILRIYPGTDIGLYQSNPSWRQKTLDGQDGRHDWRVYLCPNNDNFITRYKNDIKSKMTDLGYEGIQFAELWLEQWGGPEDNGSPRAKYACVCTQCRTKFQALSGTDPLDLLTNPNHEKYWKKSANAQLYKDWTDFRVDTVTNFGKAIVSAAKEGNSSAKIDVMILSAARVEPTKLREYQAVDVQRLLTELQPDIVSIQDAWQDWLQPNLSPAFIRDYGREYLPVIRTHAPNAYTLTHADIGSAPASKRSLPWISEFAAESVGAGFGAPSYYEWSISNMATYDWTAGVKESERYNTKKDSGIETTASAN